MFYDQRSPWGSLAAIPVFAWEVSLAVWLVALIRVTEFGLVNLKGKSIPERARAMISPAHPDFRDDLEREA